MMLKQARLVVTGLLILIAGSALVNSTNAGEAKKQKDTPLYELRIYTTAEGRLPALHKRFRDHTMHIFENHGITNIAYWTPVDQENTLVYVIAHKNAAAAEKSWAGFRKDPAWQKAYKESKKDGKIVTKVESQYLTATDFSPSGALKSGDKSRLFELRTYTTAKGRLPNLHQRFRDGELDLFTKHGMTNLRYWKPTKKENTLVYMVAHKDMAAANKTWDGFRNDPEWKKLHAASLESGPIVIKVQRRFLTPTDYSPLK